MLFKFTTADFLLVLSIDMFSETILSIYKAKLSEFTREFGFEFASPKPDSSESTVC